MILNEYQARRMLASYGVHMPREEAASTPKGVRQAARRISGPVVIKALIPAGGRGKAGGVRVCSTPVDAEAASRELLGRELLGHRVESVLIQEFVDKKAELYACVLARTDTASVELLLSVAGGIDVETSSHTGGSETLRLTIAACDILPAHRIWRWLNDSPISSFLTAAGVSLWTLAQLLATLHRAAADLDANLLEINPLAISTAGSLVAVDCKLQIDDNALDRHPGLPELRRASLNDRELRALDLGVSFVELDGDIGVIASGAGLGMATVDLLREVNLTAADFLDTGGAISENLVKGALELVMEPPRVRGAVVNLYGGINRMNEAARGIVAARNAMADLRPVVVKLIGNEQANAWELLSGISNIHVVRSTHTEEAVALLATLLPPIHNA